MLKYNVLMTYKGRYGFFFIILAYFNNLFGDIFVRDFHDKIPDYWIL